MLSRLLLQVNKRIADINKLKISENINIFNFDLNN